MHMFVCVCAQVCLFLSVCVCESVRVCVCMWLSVHACAAWCIRCICCICRPAGVSPVSPEHTGGGGRFVFQCGPQHQHPFQCQHQSRRWRQRHRGISSVGSVSRVSISVSINVSSEQRELQCRYHYIVELASSSSLVISTIVMRGLARSGGTGQPMGSEGWDSSEGRATRRERACVCVCLEL